MSTQSTWQSIIRPACLFILFLLPVHSPTSFADGHYSALNLQLNFSSGGIQNTRLGFYQGYRSSDQIFIQKSDRQIPLAEFSSDKRYESWALSIVGTRITSQPNVMLSADQSRDEKSTHTGTGKALLIGGLIAGGIYLIASEAFKDNADNLSKRSLEEGN